MKKEKKELNLIERFQAPTPPKAKRIGRIATAIAGFIGVILTTGVVTAPIGITILTITGAIATGVAVIQGEKMIED